MKKQFDYQGALAEGYTDDEIMQHLFKKKPTFDVQGALDEGYSSQEINQHLLSEPKKKKERSLLEKSGRIAGQFALGAAESAALPYELAVAPLASQEAQQTKYREGVFEDIERLQEQKQTGVWDEKDQELLTHLTEQIKNPEKSKPFVKTTDIGIRGLAEKATGLDLQPEGILEKSAHWAGFIKNPKNAKELLKIGTNPKDIIKAIVPTKTEALRGLGAGTALEMAEKGDFGPIGTLAAVVSGDVLGGGVAGLAKAAANPKKTLSEVAAAFTPKEKINIQKEIIKDFREAGIKADIGTITNNDLIKSIQSRLAQSGLTGKALNELRDSITSEIKGEYKKIADELGNLRFQTINEAGEIGKEYLTSIRNAEKSRIGDLYKAAGKSITEESTVRPIKLIETLGRIEKEMLPGAVKSTEQKAVLDIIEKIKSDIQTPGGLVKNAKIQDLINNKIALNDIINYEVQGGQKQLLKQVVHDIDEAIISHGKENIPFVKNYLKANKDFSKHAKTFRNDNINRILISQDPQILMNKMNTIQGMRDIKNALSITGEGKQVFKDLQRKKLDMMIGDKMVDNVTDQVKQGTFANLLKNPKDKQLALEILGKEAFSRLEKIQKASGRLAETAQKFFNASKSGVTVVDAGIISKVLYDLSHALAGNPWGLAKTTGGLMGARYLTKLIADPVFLKSVEEAILISSKNDSRSLLNIGKKLESAIEKAVPELFISNDQTDL